MQDKKVKLPPIYNFGERSIVLHAGSLSDDKDTEYYDPELQVSKGTKQTLKSEQDLKQSSSKALTTEVRYSEEDEIQQPAQNEPEAKDSDGDYPDDFESDSNTKRSKANERISTSSKKSRKSILDNLKPFFQSMNSVSAKSGRLLSVRSDAFKDRMAMEKEKRSSIRESHGALAYSVLNPQLENSKLDGDGEEAEEEEEERKNKSMALNNDETLYNQFSTYNLILQEALLENSVFFEKLKNEHEPGNEDENENENYEKEKEKENESGSEQENDKEEENEKGEEEEKKSPILNAYDSEFIEKVELPEDSPVEIIEVQESHDQVHEVKNFGATIEYSPENIETQKTNKRRYRSAPRQARKSITEQDDDSPIPREDQSYVHEIKSRVKASVEITKPQEVEPKSVNESIEPISTLAVTMPVPVTVSKPVVLAATMPNNQRNINNSKSVVKARPRVFLNDTTKQQDLNRYKKPGMESSQKLILPTKKPPVPRCVSVPRKPVAVNMSQNLDESINKGVMRSKARMNKLPIVIQQNATQPRKLNSNTYFSDKIANIIMYHTGGKNDADLFYQNNVLIKQIAQISGFLKNLKMKEEKKKRSIPEGKLAWILDEIRINQHIIETRTEEYNRLCGLMEKATNVEYRINLDKEIKATKELCKKEEREMRNLDFLDKKELYSHPSTTSFSYANVPPHIQAMIRMNHINSAMDSYKRQELNLKEKNKKMALQRVQQEAYLKVLEDRHQQLQADYDELEGEYIVDENGQKMHTKLFSSGKLQIFVNPATEEDEDRLEILKKEIDLEERLLEMNKQEIERKTGILEDLNSEINKLRELCPGTDEVLLDYRDSAEFAKSSEYYQNSANLSIECKSFLKNDSTILISYDQEIEKMDDMLNSKIGHRMIYKSGDCSLENSAVKANYEESQKRKFQEAYDDGQVIVKGKPLYSKQSSNMSQLKEKTESQNDNKMTGKSEVQSEKKEDLVVSQVIQGTGSKTMITSNQNMVTKKESSVKGSHNLTENHVKEPSTKEIKEEIISHSVTHTNPKTISDNKQLASQIDTSIHTSIIEGSSIHPTQKVTESIQNQTVNKTNSIELTSDHTVPATIPAIDRALTKKTTGDSFPSPEKDHEISKRSDNSQVVSAKKENSFRSGVDTKDLTNLQSYRQPSVKRQGTGSVKTNQTPLVKDSEAEYLAEEFEDDSSMRNPPKSKSIYSSARVSQKEGPKTHNNTPSEAKSIKTQLENERIETGSFQPELNSKDVANFQPLTKQDRVTSTKRYQTPQAKDSEAEYLAEGFEDDSSMRNPQKSKSIYSSARGQTDLKSGKTQTEGGTTGVPMSHKESHFQPELNGRDVMNFQPSSKRDGFISTKTYQTPQGKDSEAEYLAEGFEDDSSLRAPDRVKSVHASEKHSKNGNTPAGLSSNRVKLGNESVEQVNQSQAKQKEAVLFTFQDADNDESGNLVRIMGIGQLGNASQSNETIMNRGSGNLMQNKKKTKREELNDSDEDYNLNYSAKNLPEVKNIKVESKMEKVVKKTDISPGSTKNNRYEINSEE